MPKILVTGGCGYIWSHTIVDLVENGYDVISVDNNSRSGTRLLEGVKKIIGRDITNYTVDLCDFEATRKIFQQHKIDGIIHFAAFKSVEESVQTPLLYFQNNLISQINILRCTEEFNVSCFVFSSSCSVYGNADVIPVTEDTPLKKAESPYGRTKQIGEDMIMDVSKVSNTRFILLRYFNPTGAHPSAIIGEVPFGRPSNLVPAITQTAAGKLPALKVYGSDYDTRDGSCIRDFVHVSDIAHAHTLAVDYLTKTTSKPVCEILNLGTGNGVTVLEAIGAFERVTGIKLNYTIGERRPGDVVAVYANNDKARKLLHWSPKFSLDDMMRTAWNWELVLGKTS
ncbi:MAG TPA: UDP-glucose 4-epimerase GalE [Chitinophagaceae bacterium]|nr:UDP-glucose 4-epimerase GalE [Chitinophagaceae bacterium]